MALGWQLTHTQLPHIQLAHTWIVTLRGRRGTAWHLWHWVGAGGALGSQAALGRRGVLRGRRGAL